MLSRKFTYISDVWDILVRALAQPILLRIGTYIVKIQQNLFTSLVRKRAVKKNTRYNVAKIM